MILIQHLLAPMRSVSSADSCFLVSFLSSPELIDALGPLSDRALSRRASLGVC